VLTPQQKAALTRANNCQQENEANEAIALAALERRELINFSDPCIVFNLTILLAPRRAMVKAKDLAIWQKPTAGNYRGSASSSKRTLSRSPSTAPVAKKAKQSKSYYPRAFYNY
jgi:hypothetical protein